MSAILTGTKHATPKPRIVDPSEVKVESGIPFPKTRCRNQCKVRQKSAAAARRPLDCRVR